MRIVLCVNCKHSVTMLLFHQYMVRVKTPTYFLVLKQEKKVYFVAQMENGTNESY